jgi:hypothetical protein
MKPTLYHTLKMYRMTSCIAPFNIRDIKTITITDSIRDSNINFNIYLNPFDKLNDVLYTKYDSINNLMYDYSRIKRKQKIIEFYDLKNDELSRVANWCDGVDIVKCWCPNIFIMEPFKDPNNVGPSYNQEKILHEIDDYYEINGINEVEIEDSRCGLCGSYRLQEKKP